MRPRLRIARVKVEGTAPSNCYLVACATTSEAVVIDPGADPDKVVEQCRGLKVVRVLLTHGHRNHAGAKDEVQAAVGGETAMSLLDAKAYLRSADRYLVDGDRLPFGEFEIEVISTPGHSPGSLCFKVGNHLFTGDTLRAGDIGPTNLPDQDLPRQLTAVLSRLLALPENTVIYPGHGPTSTVGQERLRNLAVEMLRRAG
ncbi:MAG: MBL fold metallo-hydrolase [Candidatus Dormiibacterota bacterium]